MLPPEITAIFKDWPFGLLLVFLASPFLILFAAIITVIVQRVRDKGNQTVAEKNASTEARAVDVSETEAETHAFQAIVDGFKESIGVISQRAIDAEATANSAKAESKAAQAEAKAAKEETGQLSGRVKTLEDQQHDAINHIGILEAMIPYPPGPPPRPNWMSPRFVQEFKQIK